MKLNRRQLIGGAAVMAAMPGICLLYTSTAAIAKHTNAFKLNEDVVIPLERLGEYSDEIERINIEFSFKNKIRIAGAFIERLADTALDERPGITFARDLAARCV